MRHCIYNTAFGCLKSERCNCDKEIKKENSKMVTPKSSNMGKQALEDSISKELREIANNSPNADQFKDI